MRYKDVADKPEDDRIREIGNATMARPGQLIAFITDSDPGKAERYIRKLTERFPELEVVGKFDGPVKNTVTVKVRRK